MDESKIVVVLPAYEPENRLTLLASTLAKIGFNIVIVNDGSNEKYGGIFEKCGRSARILEYPKNRGKGHALKFAFKYIVENFANLDYVITADCDGQHTIKDIQRIGEEISKQKCPIIGFRVFDFHVPFRSVFGNSISKFSQSIFTYRYLFDNQCGLRAFPINDLPALIKIKGERYEYEMNVITYLLLKEKDYRMLEVEAIYENDNKTTHFRNVRDTLRIHSTLFWYGLIRYLSFGVSLLFSFIFFRFVYPITPNFPRYELSAISAFAVGLLFDIVLSLIVHRPKHYFKMIIRTIIYELITFLIILISVIIFGELLHLHITLAYFIGILISIVPLFLLTKAVAMVNDSQNR